MPSLSIFPFCDSEFWCCIILILPCADSEVCLMLSSQGWERAFGKFTERLPTSLTQSLRQELPSYYLQLSQTLSQKGALKSEFPAVTLNSAICLPMHHAGFASLPFQKKRGQFASCTLLRSKKHTIAYPSFYIYNKYQGTQKNIKILLNTINYSENKSNGLTMTVKKKSWQ